MSYVLSSPENRAFGTTSSESKTDRVKTRSEAGDNDVNRRERRTSVVLDGFRAQQVAVLVREELVDGGRKAGSSAALERLWRSGD
jgi:hypothetical protein